MCTLDYPFPHVFITHALLVFLTFCGSISGHVLLFAFLYGILPTSFPKQWSREFSLFAVTCVHDFQTDSVFSPFIYLRPLPVSLPNAHSTFLSKSASLCTNS